MSLFNVAAGTAHSRVASMGRPAKSTIKKLPASQVSVRPGKLDAQTTKAVSRKVVIPTARPDDRGTVDCCDFTMP